MKLLHDVIDKGGFICLGIYMPKEIWTQDDVVVEAVELKLAACEVVSELFKNWNQRSFKKEEDEQLSQEMEGMVLELNYLHEKLSSKLTCIKPIAAKKKEKKAIKPKKKRELCRKF